MDICTDAVDWVGDWLMELASKEEGERFGTEKLGLVLFNLTTEAANAKYLFRWKG